jgi:hypothetical protein
MSVIVTLYILTLWIVNNQRENLPKDGLPQPEVEFALGHQEQPPDDQAQQPDQADLSRTSLSEGNEPTENIVTIQFNSNSNLETI